MSEDKEKLKYSCLGSEWPEHEDYLIGNRNGLVRLREAIEEALDKGESLTDSGDFIGVRCLGTEYFEDESPKVSKWSSLLGGAIGISIVGIFIVGLITVFSWFGDS